MKAIIAAAGYGTRMLPLTKVLPKELLPVGNKPVIQYIVEGLVGMDIRDILIITSQGKFAIEDYFDKNYELEAMLVKKNNTSMLEAINAPKDMANFCFVRQKEQRGFPHAVLATQPRIDGDFFMLTVGDTVFHPDVFGEAVAMHQATGAGVVVCQRVPHDQIFRYGVVEYDDAYRITNMLEKPDPSITSADCIQVGVYILPTSIYAVIDRLYQETDPSIELSLPDVMLDVMRTQELYACVTDAGVRDTGNPAARLKANNELHDRTW